MDGGRGWAGGGGEAMTNSFSLSILDQSPISEGLSGSQALRNTIDLAQLADRLGFHRYWVAEHHGGPMLAGPSPEALIGPIAAATSHIRVGSGGVMLPHYSPFKVAESFSLLSGLFPGRIDLALGRAAGTDPLTTFALQRDRRQAAPDDFPQQLIELLGYLDDRLPADHPFARLYRERFAEHEHAGAKPRVAVGVWVICAETDEEARRLAASGRMTFTLLRRGQLIAVPPPEVAVEFFAAEERSSAPGQPRSQRRAIVGAPATVRAELEDVVAKYKAEEAIVLSITYAHEARRRSYELLAEEFGLGG
jgi:alkanesulfonate monooxygenase SsuD/methylene tetrahydromethanopterin reductase-like flavin-dependent oxidoreductase (luciferase family)